jgi:DNA-directed RNA polymerase specialized sigma24 family protein
MTAQEQETIFRRWLDQHLGLMLKVVRGCAAAPQDQDDLFQEVLLNVWPFAARLKRRLGFIAWPSIPRWPGGAWNGGGGKGMSDF